MKFLLTSMTLLLCLSLFGQDQFVEIQDIHIQNNKRTKAYIILRELSIAPGDSIAVDEIASTILKNRNQLLNTGLFADVSIKTTDWQKDEGFINFNIAVKENWYLYPYAWVDFVDNDFNVWWDVYDHQLNRTLPYIGLKHVNLTGQQDELNAYLQVGFTDRVRLSSTFLRKVRLSYTSPYLDRKQSLRATGSFLLGNDKRIRLNTFNNRDSFITNEQIPLLKRIRLDAGLNYRPQLFEQHEFRLSYVSRTISEGVAFSNPIYFGQQNTQQRFLSLAYRFISDRRDFQLYARRGYYLEAGIRKEGFGIWKERDALVLDANYARFYSFSPDWSLETSISLRTNLGRNAIDYYNLPVVGPKPEVVRGYISYHLRGSDFAYFKSSFRFQLLERYLQFSNIRLFKRNIVPQSYRNLPIQAFLKFNNDLAYINDPIGDRSNALNNRVLYGGGLGLDLILANTALIELMLNVNDLRETSFRAHTYFAF